MKKRGSIRKIEKLVESRHISYYKLAKEAGISRTAITYWRDGICEPKLKSLKKIADVLGVEVTELI